MTGEGEPDGFGRLTSSQFSACVTATSRAFWPDPMFGFFSRSALQEHRILPHYIAAVMGDAFRHGEVDVIERRGRVVASASWLRPGETPRGAWREMRVSVRCAWALLGGRNRVKGLSLLSAIDDNHPDEPHWYLALLGVDPAFQGAGLGGHLLTTRLRQCDTEQVPAYLETQKSENLPFYERFGFVVTKKIEINGCPPVWLMWRDPREPHTSDS